MFDTLDIILSFIVVIIILCLTAQSIQSVIKRLCSLKSKQAFRTVMDIITKTFGSEILKNKTIQKEILHLRQGYKVTDLSHDNLKALAEKITDLKAIKDTVHSRLNIIDPKSVIMDKLDSESKTAKEDYADNMQQVSIIIALLLALFLNADSLQMIEKISSDKVVRQVIVQSDLVKKKMSASLKDTSKTESAEVTKSEEISTKEALENIAELTTEYQGLNIGIKWGTTKKEFIGIEEGYERLLFVGKKIIGILITAFLISMGAPFWYDILDILFGLKNKLRKSSA